MGQSRKLTFALGAISAVSGIGLVAWAVAAPLFQRARANELVDRAEALLSPPFGDAEDVTHVDCDGAEAALRAAVETDRQHGRAQRLLPLAAGCASFQRGDMILAEGELRMAVQRLREDPRPLVWLGFLDLEQDRPVAARERFERALALDEDFLPAAAGLSDSLSELALTEHALRVLEPWAVSAPALVDVRRGMLLEDLGRVDEAREAYQRATDRAPRLPAPRNNLAALERDAGNLEAAWEHQSAALELAPEDPLMLLNTGLLALSLGRDEVAEEHFRRAAELDPESALPVRALADHYLVTGRLEEALTLLGRALERFPRDAALLNSLGNALAAAGRADDARESYRRAIGVDASLAQPHNGLAALMLAEGDLDGAERELRRASSLDPDDTQVHRNLAELSRRRAGPSDT